MCPAGGFCRLCLCSSPEIKELVDENGQYNNIYEIAARYFEPMLLTTVICANCWQHIYEFYEFQQSVLKAQTELGNVKNNNESIVKLELMLTDEEDEVNKEDPKDNVSAPYTISLKHSIEDEVPLMLVAKKEANEEDIPNTSISNSFNLKYTNSYESEDEIPQSKYSIKKIKQLKNVSLTKTKKHTKNIKKHKKLTAIDDSKKVTEISEEFNFACMYCDLKFKHAKNLSRHTTTHTRSKGSYQCPYCETIFFSTKNIYRHVKSFHPNEKSSFNIKNLKCLQKDVNLNANVTKMDIVSKEDAKVICPNKEELNTAQKNQVKVTSDTNNVTTEEQL